DFAFYGQMILGQKEIKPRWKRCVAMTDGALGEMLGKTFVDKVFPGDSKAIALEMIKRIEAALQKTFPTLAWMDDPTRARAEEKLHMLSNKIGYPDKWRDYSGLQVTKGDFFTSALASRRFEYRYQADKVGGPADRGEWLLTPPTVNAYYNPTLNEMV